MSILDRLEDRLGIRPGSHFLRLNIDAVLSNSNSRAPQPPQRPDQFYGEARVFSTLQLGRRWSRSSVGSSRRRDRSIGPLPVPAPTLLLLFSRSFVRPYKAPYPYFNLLAFTS
jgi:hypothetical protein